MKTGSDALVTAEKESGRNTKKREPTASVLSKMSPGVQNMKTTANVIDFAEKVSWRSKLENGTRRPRYRKKRVRERKT
jgi:hypothetical protein